MRKYRLQRVFIALLTIFVVITATFFLMHIIPGSPFNGGNDQLTEEALAAIEANYGLDKPLWEQYLVYIGNLFHGNFGTSITYTNRTVTQIILQAFPVSFDLGTRALLVGIIAGILLGISAALNHNKAMDRAATVIAIVGISIPSFVLGTLLQTVLGLWLSGWIKTLFHTSFQLFPISRWETFRHTIIPTFVLSLGTIARIARMMRSSMLDVISMDYVNTAKAKGISRRAVVWKHIVRNALTPVITIIGPMIGSVCTGSFVIESLFAIPGLGKYYVNSVTARDYTLTMGLTIFYAIFVVASTLLVDLLYVVVDPRVSLTAKEA
ncbi:MAG: ABC transporter permease [Clostridia bacterium]|nr:ABC transporter permease [Clostridia bacterium]